MKSLGEVSKELARMWRDTTDRSKFDQLSALDKARYEQEKGCAGNKSTKRKASPKRARSKKATQKSPSKRTPSAYMLFCKEFRASIVDDKGQKLPLGETTKRLASMWKSCDDETRKRFETLAQEEKQAALAQV